MYSICNIVSQLDFVISEYQDNICGNLYLVMIYNCFCWSVMSGDDQQSLVIYIISSHVYYVLEHIGHVCKMSVSGYIDRQFKPCLHQYVVSLSKTLNLHFFSQLSWELSTTREYPHEGCLFSAMSFPEEIAQKKINTSLFSRDLYLLIWNSNLIFLILSRQYCTWIEPFDIFCWTNIYIKEKVYY